jgi:aminoglycoside 3-N-acetyltransferase
MSNFKAMGKGFEQEFHILSGKVGNAQARLMSQPALVDYCVKWIEQHRD